MKPANLKTKIFLDSGDPAETREAIRILGFLDGQTTNPTLIAKNPQVKARIDSGHTYTKTEILEFYKKDVQEISLLIPKGSVSIEVYDDDTTTCEQMVTQAKTMFSWIPNAHIKFPITTEGMKAAEQCVHDGLRVNMTLVFSQQQAAAVYSATKGAQKGDVFLSPFIGRLDDIGQNGIDLIRNILLMYKRGDGHVEVLTASVRSYDHLIAATSQGTDIVTAPLHIYKEWAEKGVTIPQNFVYNSGSLAPIAYKELDLSKPWQEFDVHNELTQKGTENFTNDWNRLLQQPIKPPGL